MTNEEFTQNDTPLSEKEIDGVSGGAYVYDAIPKPGETVVTCPVCGKPTTVLLPEGGYQCTVCRVKFGQDQGSTRKFI